MGRRRTNNTHLPRRMYLEHGAYYLRPAAGGRVPLGRDYATAMAEYGRLTAPTTKCTTMADVFDRYLLEVLPMKRERTRKDQTKELGNLRVFFGEMDPQDVDAPSIYLYMKERGAPVRANREKALLSHVFTKCIEWGSVKLNPCVGVKRFREEKQTHVPSADDIAWFRRWAGDMLNAYLDIKLATGLRQGDLLKIRVNQITDTELVVPVSKSQRADSRTGRVSAGKVQRYILTPDLKAYVRAARTLRAGTIAPTLFANTEREPYTSSGFQSIWQTHMRKAIAKAAEEGVPFTRFRDHHIRALAGKEAKAAGLDAQRFLAHDDPKQTSDYINRGEDAILPLPVRK